MSVFTHVAHFLKTFCSGSSPILLALSGGPDSLCLFYCLLKYRKLYGIPFHIAHVDHGWRPESTQEAKELEILTSLYQVPFHLKTLDPHSLQGNLEAACREERYQFFKELNQQFDFQATLTGHHQNDQAETVFKRILEGSHWSHWIGLRKEHEINGIKILRPLLEISKKEIQQFLKQ